MAYVGASARLRKRFKQHVDLLRLNRHHCKKLQNDWNALGPDCFVLISLEVASEQTELCARERAWTRKCLIEGRVYNKQNAVKEEHRLSFRKQKPKWPESTVAKNAKEYIFISPDQKEVRVKGLRGICEAYGLNPSHMSKVARGLYVQHSY